LQPGDVILQSSFQPASIFYAERPITLALFKNTSGLNGEALRRSAYFPLISTADELDDNTMQREGQQRNRIILRLLRRTQRVYVLLRRKDFEDERKSLVGARAYEWLRTAGAHTTAHNNDWLLVSNQPAPAGFAYESEPMKR
jgi:hypothetical protein